MELCKIKKAKSISALGLAYIGDAVFELLVRDRIINLKEGSVNKMHKTAATYVNADAQSKMYHMLLDIITEEEEGVLKRGRNAKSFTKPKNKRVTSYRHATGLEALFGYLYIKNDQQRINFLFEKCVSCVEELIDGPVD